MARVATHRPITGSPPFRGQLILGFVGCELVATAVDLVVVGIPLWLGLRAGQSSPLPAASVLATTLWLATVLRLFDVARPLLAVHVRRLNGEAVPAALGEPA